jgi:hypothetical protein
VILAASSAIEPAWEGDSGSIYTRGVVDGIRSGAADLDGDGRITARELHTHVAALLRKEGRQSPRKFEFDDAGELVVARPGNQPVPVQSLVSKPGSAGCRRDDGGGCSSDSTAAGPTTVEGTEGHEGTEGQAPGSGLDPGDGGGSPGNFAGHSLVDRGDRIPPVTVCYNDDGRGGRNDDHRPRHCHERGGNDRSRRFHYDRR